MAGYKMKRLILLGRYYGKAAASRFMGWLPTLLFSVSIFMFIRILMLPNGWVGVERFELTGSLVRIEAEPVVRQMPVAGAAVQIGGFRAESDTNGDFHLPFLAKQGERVPVVITHDTQTVFHFVRFSRGQNTIHEVLHIP
jgi:hypothetical protein